VAVLAAPALPLRDAIARRLGEDGWSVADSGIEEAPDLLCVVVDTMTAPQESEAALRWTREALDRLYRETVQVVGAMREQRRGAVVFVCTASPSRATEAVCAAVVLEAVNGFAWSLALELGSRGITVNTVIASAVDGDTAATTLRRAGDPVDVADAVLFLATSATFVTGESLSVSGGAAIGRLTL
jgi:3-oxoacyl-[acyl-carrier protein] reductase